MYVYVSGGQSESGIDPSYVLRTTPQDIAEELKERAPITFRLLCGLLRKPEDSEDSIKQRVGLASSVIFNLANQQLNVYAVKLGVMLKASGQCKKFSVVNTN